VVREFDRLKNEEYDKLALEWNVNRILSKINYQFHTDAIKNYLIPPRISNNSTAGIVYASEADMLNIALFGVTAKEWQAQNTDFKGNMRDYATTEQLLVLANLENLNAHLIKEGLAQNERLEKLNEVAIYQMAMLSGSKLTKRLE
jgi:hypothetical protein